MESFERLVVIVAGVFSLISAGYSWVTWRSRANSQRLDKVENRIEEAEGGFVERLESSRAEADERQQKEHAEIRGELLEVHKRLNGIARTVNRLDGEIKSQGSILRLINQHLLGKGESK